MIRAASLNLPRISGSVTVTLEEIDRLRAEHAAAVNLAKELEEHQAEVRVVVLEEFKNKTFAGRGIGTDGDNYIHYTDTKEISRSYSNFEAFRDAIAKEEFNKVENIITQLRKDLDEAREIILDKDESIRLRDNGSVATHKELKVAKDVIETQDKQVKELQEKVIELTDSLNILKADYETLNRYYTERGVELLKAQGKITFWGWVKTWL